MDQVVIVIVASIIDDLSNFKCKNNYSNLPARIYPRIHRINGLNHISMFCCRIN